MPIPHAHGGCKCRYCYGFAEAITAITGRTYPLPAAPGHGVLTADPVASRACDGTMTCPCDKCAADRQRIARDKAARTVRQPWETS